MATAHQFGQIAAALRRFGDDVSARVGAVASIGPGGSVEGPVHRGLEQGLGGAGDAATRLLREVEVQIAEAHRRAAVCESYTRAFDEYRRCTDGSVSRPSRQASWVSYG